MSHYGHYPEDQGMFGMQQQHQAMGGMQQDYNQAYQRTRDYDQFNDQSYDTAMEASSRQYGNYNAPEAESSQARPMGQSSLNPREMGQGSMGGQGVMGGQIGQRGMGQGSMGQGSMGQGSMGQGSMGQGSMGQGSMGQGSMGQGMSGIGHGMGTMAHQGSMQQGMGMMDSGPTMMQQHGMGMMDRAPSSYDYSDFQSNAPQQPAYEEPAQPRHHEREELPSVSSAVRKDSVQSRSMPASKPAPQMIQSVPTRPVAPSFNPQPQSNMRPAMGGMMPQMGGGLMGSGTMSGMNRRDRPMPHMAPSRSIPANRPTLPRQPASRTAPRRRSKSPPPRSSTRRRSPSPKRRSPQKEEFNDPRNARPRYKPILPKGSLWNPTVPTSEAGRLYGLKAPRDLIGLTRAVDTEVAWKTHVPIVVCPQESTTERISGSKNFRKVVHYVRVAVFTGSDSEVVGKLAASDLPNSIAEKSGVLCISHPDHGYLLPSGRVTGDDDDEPIIETLGRAGLEALENQAGLFLDHDTEWLNLGQIRYDRPRSSVPTEKSYEEVIHLISPVLGFVPDHKTCSEQFEEAFKPEVQECSEEEKKEMPAPPAMPTIPFLMCKPCTKWYDGKSIKTLTKPLGDLLANRPKSLYEASWESFITCCLLNESLQRTCGATVLRYLGDASVKKAGEDKAKKAEEEKDKENEEEKEEKIGEEENEMEMDDELASAKRKIKVNAVVATLPGEDLAAFRYFDINCVGYLEASDIIEMMPRLSNQISLRRISAMTDILQDGDRRVKYANFKPLEE